MENNKEIFNGAFFVARQIFTSNIWKDKPASWKVIWIYILGQVNHKDNGKFKRGEGFFNLTEERKQIGIDITYNQIREFLRYSKSHKMINTTKTTRGIVIKVLNYNKYQTLNNYQNTTENTTQNKVKTQPKHNGNTTINKNDKNDKNDKNNSAGKPAEIAEYQDDKILNKQILEVFILFRKNNPMLNIGNKTQRTAISELIKELGYDRLKQISQFAVQVQGEPYAPVITNPYNLKNKLADLRAFYERNKKSSQTVNLDTI